MSTTAAPTGSDAALTATAVNLGWIIDKLWRITEGDEPSEDLPGLPIERRADV